MSDVHHPLPVVDHPAEAARFASDRERAGWHDETLWQVRESRDRAAARVPEWETLRDAAAQIKAHTLSRLDDYLEAFEDHARSNGVQVHWARDAAEHNAIAHRILSDHGVRRVVKSKSMLTEECGLNPFLEEQGLEVVDTDLGERIVQLAKEPPSHIVMPAVNFKREEIGTLFHDTMGSPEGEKDPTVLTGVVRKELRQRFLQADAAMTGVNFGVAETGGIVICTNEGNADLGMHLAPVYIASMGIEKVIPRAQDLGVFLRLLARSATGQAITVYSSHIHRPRPGQEIHIILVDNGRSEHLGREGFRDALRCIRCGACLNTCPVYRRSGGHSYGSTVPGPIGSILTPGIDLERYKTLPFASTLCGSCSAVCPVKIDIHGQLYRWRQQIGEADLGGKGKKRMMVLAAQVLGRSDRFRRLGAVVRWFLRILPGRWLRGKWNAWAEGREMPPAPKQSFRQWYEKRSRS